MRTQDKVSWIVNFFLYFGLAFGSFKHDWCATVMIVLMIISISVNFLVLNSPRFLEIVKTEHAAKRSFPVWYDILMLPFMFIIFMASGCYVTAVLMVVYYLSMIYIKKLIKVENETNKN